MSSQPEWVVSWTIQEPADTSLEAALQIKDAFFQDAGSAVVFEVYRTDTPLGARREIIDLDDGSASEVYHVYTSAVLHRMAAIMLFEGGTAAEIVDMLEKPHNWPELLTRALLDDAFDKVATEPEKRDLTVDV